MDRFTDCDHFMQQRGWGVGHLSTRHCNNALLRDRHTLLHDNVDVPTPENEDEEVLSGHASDEGDLEEDDLEEDDLEEGELEGGELEGASLRRATWRMTRELWIYSKGILAMNTSLPLLDILYFSLQYILFEIHLIFGHGLY